jgi:hypothetical protein
MVRMFLDYYCTIYIFVTAFGSLFVSYWTFNIIYYIQMPQTYVKIMIVAKKIIDSDY